MNLMYHYHIPVAYGPHKHLMTYGFQGRFIDSLARSCDSLYLLMHEAGRGDENLDYTIQAKNVHFLPIGPHTTIPKRLLNLRKVIKIVKTNRSRIDCLLLRGPSPLLPALYAEFEPVPTALMIVGDYREVLDDIPQPYWRKNLIHLWLSWNARGQTRAMRKSIVFVNSRKLYEKLQPVAKEIIEIKTTTLTTEDFYSTTDRCISPPYRILYTGRIDKAKGLFDLVEAVRLLREQKTDVILDIVGWGLNGDPTENSLREMVKLYSLEKYITFCGFKTFGEELFHYYRNSDIYIMPSYSEGFPRSIWESMASSLPVIATTVGSIPHYLNDSVDAILIPPRKPAAIAEAVSRLIEDNQLRRSIMKNAQEKVSSITLEKTTEQLISHLRRYISTSRQTSLHED